MLKNSYRLDVNGWVYLYLEGEPFEMGYQHGYHVGERIKKAIDRVALYGAEILKRPWSFYRETAERFYEPKLSEELKMELEGIAKGAKERGVNIDFHDVVALNGQFDTLTYHYWLKSKEGKVSPAPGGGCSAFIATGSATKNGEIIMAHNSWWSYLISRDWDVMAYYRPNSGHEILMQSYPGFVWSGTDWYINSAGLMVTETTLTCAITFNPNGTPIFIRAREAIQSSDSINKWMDIIVNNNNGGYANDWLIGDAKTREIAFLELGLEHRMTKKSNDGVFVSSNLALDMEVRKETAFDYIDTATSATARFVRWNQLINNFRGQIDIEVAKRFLADHFDTSQGREIPSRCTLCGHVDSDPRGIPEVEWGPYYPSGCFDGKVTSSSLALDGSTWAHWGKPCGQDFHAKQFLSEHPEYKWQAPQLDDIASYPWTHFTAKFKAK